MRIGKTFERFFFALIGRRFQPIDGLDNLPDEPFIVAMNHIDWLDGFLLTVALTKVLGQRQFLFVARTNNYRIFGDYTIRLDPDQPGASLENAERALVQKKRIVGFFVEGARNAEPRLLPGKTGCARLALATGVSVVPIGLAGLSHQSTWQAIRNLWPLLRAFRIRIGLPLRWERVPLDQIDRALLDEKTRLIMERLAELSEKSLPQGNSKHQIPMTKTSPFHPFGI